MGTAIAVSNVGRCNKKWQRLWPPLGKKRRVLCNSRPCYQDCCHTGLLYASLIWSNPPRLKGDELPCDGPMRESASVNMRWGLEQDKCQMCNTSDSFIHSFIHSYSIWLKHTAKWAGQQGKLLLLLAWLKTKEINTAIQYIRCVYILETI